MHCAFHNLALLFLPETCKQIDQRVGTVRSNMRFTNKTWL